MDPIDFFQDHLTYFYHCVTNWLLSRPFDLILSLCTILTPFKTIWPNFIIVYHIDSFQDPLTQLSNMYPIDFFQDHMTWFLHYVPIGIFSRPFDLIL